MTIQDLPCTARFLYLPASDHGGAKPRAGENSEKHTRDATEKSVKDSLRVIDSSRVSLDEVDRKILEFLSADSRTPFLSIASELKVDEKTIRNRVGKLRDAGVIQCSVLVQPNKLEDYIVVHLGIRLKAEAKSHRAQIADELAQLQGVNWCSALLGTYDLLLQAVFPSFAAMKRFELDTITRHPALECAESMLTLSHHGTHGVPSQPDNFSARETE